MQKSYMKSYYYFIRQPMDFNAQSVILHVKVGNSDRECAQLALLLLYCKDAGYYLQPVSIQSDTAIDFMLAQVFKGKKIPRLHARTELVTISQLYTMIMDGTLESFEASVKIKRAQVHVLNILDPAFRFLNRYKNQSNICQPLSRNYLSDSGDSQGSFVALVAVIVASLFLLAGRLEYLENQMYF